MTTPNQTDPLERAVDEILNEFERLIIEQGSIFNYQQTETVQKLLTLVREREAAARISEVDKAIASVKRNPDKALDLLWKHKGRIAELEYLKNQESEIDDDFLNRRIAELQAKGTVKNDETV